MLGRSATEEKKHSRHAGRVPCRAHTSEDSILETQDLTIDYRVKVIATGLILSWSGLIVFALWTISLPDFNGAEVVGSVGGLLLVLGILTFVPWRSLLTTLLGEWLLVGWTIAANAAVLMFEIKRPGQPSGVGSLLITFFGAATLVQNRTLITIGALTGAAYAVAVMRPNGLDTEALVGNLLPLIGAMVFVLLLSMGIRSQLEQTNDAYRQLSDRESALTQQERELSQLYDISRTIGAGSKLNEVLPELVGRVAKAVNARIGLVLLYNPETEQLDLMSPIAVAGRTVHADEFHLGLDQYGIGQRVFMSGDAEAMNVISNGEADDRLVTQLGEQPHGGVEAVGGVVVELRRNHLRPPLVPFS